MLSSLGTTPYWLFLAWASILFFFSPVFYLVAVCLPELPLLLVRRICYIPFDAV